MSMMMMVECRKRVERGESESDEAFIPVRMNDWTGLTLNSNGKADGGFSSDWQSKCSSVEKGSVYSICN